MSIYQGTKQISKIYHGTTQIKKIYQGTTLVYEYKDSSNLKTLTIEGGQFTFNFEPGMTWIEFAASSYAKSRFYPDYTNYTLRFDPTGTSSTLFYIFEHYPGDPIYLDDLIDESVDYILNQNYD